MQSPIQFIDGEGEQLVTYAHASYFRGPFKESDDPMSMPTRMNLSTPPE